MCRHLLLALQTFLICVTLLFQAETQAKPGNVTSAQVNGTWSKKNGAVHIMALGNQLLYVQVEAIYAYESPAGPTANLGEAHGIAFIDGHKANFPSVNGDRKDEITLNFVNNALIVTQTGRCGFGLHVTADGIYHKTSKKPDFNTEFFLGE